jgi:hypothetical protein
MTVTGQQKHSRYFHHHIQVVGYNVRALDYLMVFKRLFT